MWGHHPEWWESGTPPSDPPPVTPTEYFKDYSPDRNPSFSDILTGAVNGRCIRVWVVRGVGVLCMEMTGDPETGRMSGTGLRIFTKEEIGWAPNL